MGIGRRAFIKLAGIALAGAAMDPLNAVAVNQNTYINKKLGIMFQKPKDWGFIAIKDFGKLKNEQIIGQGLDMSTDDIWDEIGEPICIVTKYHQDTPENKGVFSPTITLNITPKEEFYDLGIESFEELREMSALGTSMLLKDFQIVKTYKPYLISQCEFYEYDAEYLFEHTDIPKPLKVELKVLKTEHNGFYYDFNCHQSKAQDQTANKAFETFKHSIKLI